MDALDVFRCGEKVGILFDETPLRFEYAESWRNRSDATPVDPDLSLSIASHTGAAVEAYFENLLPEAHVREFLQLRNGASINDTAAGFAHGETEEGIRIFLAGAQTKTSVFLDGDGTPAIPLGASPSTHIVKPDIKGMAGVWCSALNETLVMRLAAATGIGAAEVAYQPLVKACVVKRYDRLRDGGEYRGAHGWNRA